MDSRFNIPALPTFKWEPGVVETGGVLNVPVPQGDAKAERQRWICQNHIQEKFPCTLRYPYRKPTQVGG